MLCFVSELEAQLPVTYRIHCHFFLKAGSALVTSLVLRFSYAIGTIDTKCSDIVRILEMALISQI